MPPAPPRSAGVTSAAPTTGRAAWFHDDAIDALDRAIAQGHTDRDRVAIHGGSAALAGAASTPDRFADAITHTGLSDLVDLTRSVVSVGPAQDA